MKSYLPILCIMLLFIACKKDIPTSDIGNREIIISQDSCVAFLPNAFSPDGNGRNDALRPIMFNVNDANFTFTVRNLKQKILFTTNKKTDVWSAAGQPEGEYIVTIKGTFSCGNSFEEHTCVNLFRECIPQYLDVNKLVFESMFDPITASAVYVSGEVRCP